MKVVAENSSAPVACHAEARSISNRFFLRQNDNLL